MLDWFRLLVCYGITESVCNNLVTMLATGLGDIRHLKTASACCLWTMDERDETRSPRDRSKVQEKGMGERHGVLRREDLPAAKFFDPPNFSGKAKAVITKGVVLLQGSLENLLV